MMFSSHQVNLLLRLVDAEIEAEIGRICTVPVAAMKYEALLTAKDMELAQQMGIALSC